MSQSLTQHAAQNSPSAPVEQARLVIFQILLTTASVSLALICFRWLWLHAEIPLADLYCAIVCILSFFLVRRRPSWLNALSWVAFFALLINASNGLPPYESAALPNPTQLLLPSLVLYGALLGHGAITLVGLLYVLTIYCLTAAQHWPLTSEEILSLSNLALLSLSLGIASFLIWQRHLKLYRTLYRQADELRSELEVNRQLISLVSHDIANPLTVITGHTELGVGVNSSPANLEVISNMARRISDIINSVRRLQSTVDSVSAIQTVTIQEIHRDLCELFEQKFQEKNQRLLLKSDGLISVRTDVQILCHSILGNFVTNALKYSPRDTEIELIAIPLLGRRVSIEIRDRGPGIDPALVELVLTGGRITPAPGTEGEKGSGVGLRIAALCARRLGAEISIHPRVGGGTVATVILPRASNEDSVLAMAKCKSVAY
jgi:signal transduction histidine kinase